MDRRRRCTERLPVGNFTMERPRQVISSDRRGIVEEIGYRQPVTGDEPFARRGMGNDYGRTGTGLGA